MGCSRNLGGATRYVDGTCGNDAWTGTSAVCQGPNGPKLTIQAGIYASSSGDVVIVAQAVYAGALNRNLVFGARNITLKCAEGAVCTVDCQDDGNFAWLDSDNGPNVTLDGFTITGGTGVEDYFYSKGGAILCDAGSSPVIRNCVLKENVADYGGGIALLSGANPIIENCVIRNNAATFGGGVSIEQGTSYYVHGRIRDSIIGPGNSASADGGGIFLDGRTDPDLDPAKWLVIKRCTILRNHAGDWRSGGGIMIRGQKSNPTFVNCLIVGNYMPGNSWGGGLAIQGHPDRDLAQEPSFVNCLFAGNRAKWGGGIHTKDYVHPSFLDSHLVGNHAASYQGWPGEGGGLRAWSLRPDSDLIPCHNMIVWGNYATEAPQLQEYINDKLLVWYSDVQGGWDGGENININPAFVGGPSGQWDSAADYDPETATTMLTDNQANWEPGELVGKLLNPNISQYLQSVIVANAPTTVTVWGDFRGVGGSGLTYKINDYHLTSASPCIDVGYNNLLPEDDGDIDDDSNTAEGLPRDLTMGPRTLDVLTVTGAAVDMGAYEFAGTIDLVATLAAPGTHDARQPHPHSNNSLSARQGIGSPNQYAGGPEPIKVKLTPAVQGANSPDYWSLCETGIELKEGEPPLEPNEIGSVTYAGAGEYHILLERPISAGHWTTISYTGDGSYVAYASMPADVNANGQSNDDDIAAIINILNGRTQPLYGNYSCDIDHSNLCAPADILRTIDLIIGADTFLPWGEQPDLAANTCPDGGVGGMMSLGGGLGGPESIAQPSLLDFDEFAAAFVAYVTDTIPRDSAAEAEFKAVVEAIAEYCVMNLSYAERQALADKLQDPSLEFASSVAAEELPNIVEVLLGKL